MSFGAKSQPQQSLKLRSHQPEEVEFPLINGSGGFNLSMVPTEVHHNKVYVRVSRETCDPDDDEYFRI